MNRIIKIRILQVHVTHTQGLATIPQPPYSPDLAPANFFLFPKVESSLKEHHHWTLKCRQRSLHAYPQGPSGIRLPGSLRVMEKQLTKVCLRSRDVLWRILRSCSNIWNKYIFSKLFPILFIQSLYMTLLTLFLLWSESPVVWNVLYS